MFGGKRTRHIEPNDIGVRYGRVVQTRDGADEDETLEGYVGRRNSLWISPTFRIRGLNDTDVVEVFLHARRKIWNQLPHLLQVGWAITKSQRAATSS